MSQPTRSREFCGRALEQPEKLWAEEAEATNTGGGRNLVADSGKVPGNNHLYLSGRHSSLGAGRIQKYLRKYEGFPSVSFLAAATSLSYRRIR